MWLVRVDIVSELSHVTMYMWSIWAEQGIVLNLAVHVQKSHCSIYECHAGVCYSILIRKSCVTRTIELAESYTCMQVHKDMHNKLYRYLISGMYMLHVHVRNNLPMMGICMIFDDKIWLLNVINVLLSWVGFFYLWATFIWRKSDK